MGKKSQQIKIDKADNTKILCFATFQTILFKYVIKLEDNNEETN